MSTHSCLATMLPIPTSIQGTVKKTELQESEKYFQYLFLHSSTTQQTPHVSPPRQRFEHQSDLAKKKPEKQELKILKGRKLFRIVLVKQCFEGLTQLDCSAEAAFQKGTRKTGLWIKRDLQVSLLTWGCLPKACFEKISLCIYRQERCQDVRFYNGYFAVQQW